MDRMDSVIAELRSRGLAPSASEKESIPTTPPAPPTPRRAGQRGEQRAVATRRRSKKTYLMFGISGFMVVFVIAPGLVQAVRSTAIKPSATPTPVIVETPTAAATSPSPADWLAVVRALEDQRAAAIIARKPALLATVDLEASDALAADNRIISRLLTEHLHVTSVPLTVISVTERYATQGATSRRAGLIIVDVLGGYDLLDAKNRVVRHVAPRAASTWNAEISQSTDGSWRYESVVPGESVRGL